MARDCMLTTFDNPFNPFEQFTSWFLFDVEKGYNSCGYLARIAKFTDDMSQKEIDDENERAIDEIIKHDFCNIYKKITNELSNEDLSDDATNEQDVDANAPANV